MKPPKFSSLTYAAVWHGCQTIFDLLYRPEIAGIENVPADGSFILACNHASFLDPPIAGSYLPRELHYFARKTLFKGRFGKLISDLNSIPIDRDGDSDLAAFRKVFGVLKSGEAILVFPEGTRTKDGKLGEVRGGVGMLACRSQVPVLPVRIFGSFDIWSRKHKYPALSKNLGLTIGPVILPKDYDPGKADKERYQNASTRIMKEIENLKAPEISGV
ncbi:lysophospholipid acyltransferase family protein [Rubellicoccus peritrichatus]|uniref:Lysophospholipid acyltransferase family protein n=1 Tax=Rubellicoccus peritrichatus TaxID=3080537 RepID=A0AAQ3LA02_9BACT|nr:lysophospholipid acyltransferase family protein [Puniceicoccus sp. CR14]WOO39628.1 lysophospholipid acyltransferase family protein [Puniceicoccus sp. CR14]